MVFVPPGWMEGALIMVALVIGIPLLVFLITTIGVGLLGKLFNGETEFGVGAAVGVILFLFALFGMLFYGADQWVYDNWQEPSVQEEVITIAQISPAPGVEPHENGIFSLTNAGELMYYTTDNRGFINRENWRFSKFETRDLFMKLKVGGTYKIKYYGWRNGQNDGFPNILSITEVVNETNAKNHTWNDYFGARLSFGNPQGQLNAEQLSMLETVDGSNQ